MATLGTLGSIAQSTASPQGSTASPYYSGVNFQQIYNQYLADQPSKNSSYEGYEGSGFSTPASTFGQGGQWGYGGYDVTPMSGGYALTKGMPGASNGTGYGVFPGQTYDLYSPQGQFLKSGNWGNSVDPSDHATQQFLTGLAMMAGPFAATIGGAGAAAGATGGMAGDATAAGYGGLDAASTASMGGGASVGGGSALGTIGADGAIGATGAAGAAGAAGMTGDATAAGYGGLDAAGTSTMGGGASVAGGAPAASTGGLSLGSLAGYANNPLVKLGLGAATSGMGGGSSGGSGGLNLGSLAGIANGAYGAYQQSQAASQMKAWMDNQMSQVNSLYSPGSPEYTQLWNQMSAKDAAAGRNSQYGPRTAQMAGQIAQNKADTIAKMTYSLANPYERALTQQANAGINFTSPLISALQGSGGSGGNYGSYLNTIANYFGGNNTNLGSGMTMDSGGTVSGIGNDGWTGGDMSNSDIENIINGWS